MSHSRARNSVFSHTFVSPSACSRRAVAGHEVLVNRLPGLSLPRKSVVRLTERPDMTMAVYRIGTQACNIPPKAQNYQLLKSDVNLEPYFLLLQPKHLFRWLSFEQETIIFLSKSNDGKEYPYMNVVALCATVMT